MIAEERVLLQLERRSMSSQVGAVAPGMPAIWDLKSLSSLFKVLSLNSKRRYAYVRTSE